MSINTKAVKTRIKSVKNTRKVTGSMEKISAVKRSKFSTLALNSKEYTKELVLTNSYFSNLLEIDDNSPTLLQKRSLDTTMLVVLTSDRGLCGSFNSNIINVTSKYIEEIRSKDPKRIIKMVSLGKKGAKIATNNGIILDEVYEKLYESDSYERCVEISRNLVKKYIDDELDEIILISSSYKNAQTQDITIEKILPFKNEKSIQEEATSEEEFVLEPAVDELIEYIFLKTVDTKLYQAVLESSASEHSSRMIAMKNATDNAGDLSDILTLTFNKGRQAGITQEVSEIVSGIEALSNL